ncbi:MAG: SAM-dependent methyltransferase [Acidobacteriota bacterium]|nr:MAG: SAM-dependent methyltransferase [Acidobacteriota bacterium]
MSVSPSRPAGAALERLLREAIRREGALPFSRFMREALYHPKLGYYMRGAHPTGQAGDFVTAPEMTPAFGGLVAAFAERLAPSLPSYTLYEFGAGAGTLARSVLRALSPPARPVRYVLVDNHPAAAQGAASLVKEGLPADALPYPLPSALSAPGGKCCLVLANEFLDSFPVEVARRRDDGGWETLHVELRGETFAEAWRSVPDDGPLRRYLERYAEHAEAGQRVEAPASSPESREPGIEAWLGDVAALTGRGVAAVFDYGDLAEPLYSPVRRLGTLKCHFRHAVDARPLERAGEKDITASVNFSYLEDAARARGFEARTVELCAFLLAMGAERYVRDEKFQGPARRGLLSLLDPTGMGGLFKVCVLSRGVELEPLKTFREIVSAAG